MTVVSAGFHAALIAVMLVVAGGSRSRPLPITAYTVELTDPKALGGHLPPGEPGSDLRGGPMRPAPPAAKPAPPAAPSVAKPESPAAPPATQQAEARVEPKPPPKPEPPKVEAKPEPKPEPPKVEPKPEPKEVAKAEEVHIEKPVAKPEPKPEAKPEAKPEPKPKPEPVAKPETKPEPPKAVAKAAEPKPEHPAKPEPAKPATAGAAAPVKGAAAKPAKPGAEASGTVKPEGGEGQAESGPRDAYAALAERWQQSHGGGLGGTDRGSGPIGAGGEGPGGGGQLVGLEFLAYRQQVINTIKAQWTNVILRPGLVAAVRFAIAQDGTVSDVQLAKPSGNAAYDASALRAVQHTLHLPPPPARYADEFREFIIEFHSEERGAEAAG